MGQVIAIAKPIEKLVIEIRSHVHDAGRAETTCAKHQLQAGNRLLELRSRIEAGEAGQVDWWEWYETQFTGHIRSRKYAEKLMRWAAADDPAAAQDADLAKSREAMRALRAERREAGTNVSSEVDGQSEYDIVEHALRLVDKMSADEREQFDAAYRSKYQ